MPLKLNHRPKDLDSVIGNEKAVAALSKLFERTDNFPHAILFSGPAGTGKTTLARIVAKHLGCSKLDFIEMNTADFRGIDTSRDVNKNMSLSPMDGKVKVYFFDEVHGLTKDAQEALLKATEEPPEHVYFIAATTEPHKLLETFRQRFRRRFETQSLSAEQVELLLKRILTKEGLKLADLPDDVIDQLIQDSNGSARVAVDLLDSIIDLDEGEMLEAVKATKIFEAQCIELCRALVDRTSWKGVGKILDGLKEDPERVRRAVLEYTASTLLRKEDVRLHWILLSFSEPYFNVGRAGLVTSCYTALHPGGK